MTKKPNQLSPDEQRNLDNRLRDAAADGRTETVRVLLASGADVHAKNDLALRWAAYHGQTETVKVLLASGADVHAGDDLALRWAAHDGHTETARTLLAAGADVGAGDDYALRWATRNGHTETLRVLQEALKNEVARRLELERQQNLLYVGTGLTFAKSRPEDVEVLLRDAIAEQSSGVSALAALAQPGGVSALAVLAQPGGFSALIPSLCTRPGCLLPIAEETHMRGECNRGATEAQPGKPDGREHIPLPLCP
jgi:hypothetical protein